MTIKKQLTTAQKHLSDVESAQGINKLIRIMQALRDPDGGCPWDQKQSYQSILPYTIEEVYEVAEAIENQDYLSLKDELGDLLFQVIFYAQIAKEEEKFDFNDIVVNIGEKLIRRHPHVFADTDYQDEKQLHQAWELQKQIERQAKSQSISKQSVLDDIPKVMPELKKAQKIQQRVAKVGFDWPDVIPVWDKLEEECIEVKEAAEEGDKNHLEEELGDLLFVMVNLVRHYGFDADIALRKANQKFDKRFRLLESLSTKPLNESSLEEMEALWLVAKKSD